LLFLSYCITLTYKNNAFPPFFSLWERGVQRRVFYHEIGNASAGNQEKENF
jgi:hypothetical protein